MSIDGRQWKAMHACTPATKMTLKLSKMTMGDGSMMALTSCATQFQLFNGFIQANTTVLL
jgi:hypothetical protein